MYLLRNNESEKKLDKQTKFINQILVAKTIWQVLGLSSNPRPTDREIRTAYIEIAKLIHPDKCKLVNSEAASKLLTIAYTDIIENKKNFKPYYSDQTGQSSTSSKSPEPPPKPSYKTKRNIRREYAEKYKLYKLAKAKEMVSFRKKLEYQNQIDATKLDLTNKTEASRRNTLDRSRKAYMNMKIESRINQLSAENLISICNDIGCVPKVEEIRKWALSTDSVSFERPYELNAKIIEVTKPSRPSALRRKDLAVVNTYGKAHDKDRHDLALERLYIRHTNIVLTNLSNEIVELEEEYTAMQNSCNVLAKDLEKLKEKMRNSESTNTTFKWASWWF